MWKVLLLVISLGCYGNGLELVAFVSQNGVHGEITFSQPSNDIVNIDTNLEETLQYPEQVFSWAIYEFAVDYAEVDPKKRCDLANLGKEIINFDDELGYLAIPENKSTTYETSNITLSGPKGVWGKSLVLSNPNSNVIICATIVAKDQSLEHMAEARFNSPIAGTIYFRWLTSKTTSHRDTLIYSNLQHTVKTAERKSIVSENQILHKWKIYATDIVENTHRATEDCNSLQLVFDPQNSGPGQSVGDLDNRVGKIKVNIYNSEKVSKFVVRDENLVLLPSDLSGPQRRLYVVIFDSLKPDLITACAEIRHIKSRILKSIFNTNNMKGEITINQIGRFNPTWLNFTFSSTDSDELTTHKYATNINSFVITELPPLPGLRNDIVKFCESGGNIFNPLEVEAKNIPPAGFGTQDQYSVGDLTGKLLNRNPDEPHSFFLHQTRELSGIYWDAFLPLYGRNSINHRTLVLRKRNTDPAINKTETVFSCGLLVAFDENKKYQIPMETVEILYRYPIVGRILLRQPKERPWEDTVILFEHIILADGNPAVDSFNHRWSIHENPPGIDFYNWTGRCLTAGGVFNPYHLKSKPEDCKDYRTDLCKLGDLGNRLGLLSIAGSKYNATKISRKMFIDDRLPLSGKYSVVGKSLVIFDDFGPKARGERLACSIIGGYARRKAVAKDWYSNGDKSGNFKFDGKLEIVQQTEYDISNLDVTFKGLDQNSGYHIHMTPVEGHLEFPCEETTLYGHFNPNRVDNLQSPPPAVGSVEKYEMGDLSGKFGTLDNLRSYQGHFNDTNLPLFGYDSVLGRSIVIHKKEKNLRWACSTLERGYSPNEAREIRAIASFHHPAGYSYGFIKFSQLIGVDGSQSETVITTKLRHPGKNDRNATLNHKWQIFVNPVGVDATVKQTVTRCVAGGYIWNPFYTQLADPLNTDLYEQECGADNPLRCYVGDVSARLGTININGERAVFTDPNFPLEGPVSAVGRSIVIFGPNLSNERFACANIEPDHNIIKFINIQKPPRFVVAQFLEDVRHVMGLPEWMLAIDSRKTKIIHNGACMQMIIHFLGPKAHQIELDFSRLLASGRLDAPSVSVPGFDNPKRKKTLSYKLCGVIDTNEKKTSKRRYSSILSSSGAHHSTILSTVILIISGLVTQTM